MTPIPNRIAKAVYVTAWLTALTLMVGLALMASVIRTSATLSAPPRVPTNQLEFDSPRVSITVAVESRTIQPPSATARGRVTAEAGAPLDTVRRHAPLTRFYDTVA